MIKKNQTNKTNKKHTHKHKNTHKKPTENNNKNSAEILPCYWMCY